MSLNFFPLDFDGKFPASLSGPLSFPLPFSSLILCFKKLGHSAFFPVKMVASRFLFFPPLAFEGFFLTSPFSSLLEFAKAEETSPLFPAKHLLFALWFLVFPPRFRNLPASPLFFRRLRPNCGGFRFFPRLIPLSIPRAAIQAMHPPAEVDVVFPLLFLRARNGLGGRFPFSLCLNFPPPPPQKAPDNSSFFFSLPGKQGGAVFFLFFQGPPQRPSFRCFFSFRCVVPPI